MCHFIDDRYLLWCVNRSVLLRIERVLGIKIFFISLKQGGNRIGLSRASLSFAQGLLVSLLSFDNNVRSDFSSW